MLTAFSPPLPCASCDADQISAATEEKMMKLFQSAIAPTHPGKLAEQGGRRSLGARRATLARPEARGRPPAAKRAFPAARALSRSSGSACLAPRGLPGEEPRAREAAGRAPGRSRARPSPPPARRQGAPAAWPLSPASESLAFPRERAGPRGAAPASPLAPAPAPAAPGEKASNFLSLSWRRAAKQPNRSAMVAYRARGASFASH